MNQVIYDKEEINKEEVKELTPGSRLKSIRTQLRRSRSYISQTYGVPIDTLRAWESDKVKLTEKGLTRCINIYRNEGVILSKAWILTGEGLDPKISVEISKYFSHPSAIQQLNENQTDDTLLMLKEAEFFKNSTNNSVILLVSTEEMLPYYAPGDYVGGRFRYRVEEIDEAVGKDCIVSTKKGEKFFRRLSKNSADGTYNLICHNPVWGGTLEPVLFDVMIEAVAPVIWHRRPE